MAGRDPKGIGSIYSTQHSVNETFYNQGSGALDAASIQARLTICDKCRAVPTWSISSQSNTIVPTMIHLQTFTF